MLLALLVVEWVLYPPMARLAPKDQAPRDGPVVQPAGLPDFCTIRSGDPAEFFAWVRGRLKPATVVFIGDSQGINTKDRQGPPYPQLVARGLAGRTEPASVLSLHLDGTNTFEQGTLLLGMLQAGIVPRAVFWSHSVHSLRKNNIRAELLPLYESLPAGDTGGAKVTPIGNAPRRALPLPQRILETVSRRLDDWSSASAAVRFSRRELWEKGRLLWSSRAAALVPRALRPRTAEQHDPSAFELEVSAAFAGKVTGVLARHGVRVISFLGPICQSADPRPFSVHSEAIAYPALERAVRRGGGEFVSWIDLLPDSSYGTYEDGSQDPFHVREAGHEVIARRCLGLLDGAAGGR